jgi:hypothetical protein
MIREYETHSTLNPKLWDGNQLRPKLRAGFMKIAKEFYNFLEVDALIKDVILIGSNANYNWTKWSDIDLHVVINYMEVGDNLHLVSNYMHAKKSIWNINYPLKYKDMNIELYAQDSNDELHSSVGIYSLLRDKWIKQPSADIVSVDDAAIQTKAEPYEYEIDALKESDPQVEQKIKNIKQRLQHLRKTGLEAEGEYSIENMAYKHLRNKGYIERLKRLEQTVLRGRLSIEHAVNERYMGSITNKTKDQIKKFASAMKTESSETKMALSMLLQHINGQKLNDVEWAWVRNQMKDVIKILGLTTMAVAPGGSILAILAKALKADKYLLPSSMLKKDEQEITESLIGHVTKTKPLHKHDWDTIIHKTGGIVDPQGQWNHPGRCTMIPTSNGQITMIDVPHPVLGIDETGHMIMMHPEYDYQFPGRNVFEIPHTAQWKTMVMQIQNALNNKSGVIDAKW